MNLVVENTPFVLRLRRLLPNYNPFYFLSPSFQASSTVLHWIEILEGRAPLRSLTACKESASLVRNTVKAYESFLERGVKPGDVNTVHYRLGKALYDLGAGKHVCLLLPGSVSDHITVLGALGLPLKNGVINATALFDYVTWVRGEILNADRDNISRLVSNLLKRSLLMWTDLFRLYDETPYKELARKYASENLAALNACVSWHNDFTRAVLEHHLTSSYRYLRGKYHNPLHRYYVLTVAQALRKKLLPSDRERVYLLFQGCESDYQLFAAAFNLRPAAKATRDEFLNYIRKTLLLTDL